MRRRLTVTAMVAAFALAAPAVAVAQEPEPEPPAEVNCFPLLSSLVCHIPVNVGPFNIGPFGPFVLFPNGLGSPPAPTS